MEVKEFSAPKASLRKGHKTINHTAHHKTMKSKTLMRNAVSKPELGIKRRIKVSAALESRRPMPSKVDEQTYVNFQKEYKKLDTSRSRSIRHYNDIKVHVSRTAKSELHPARHIENYTPPNPFVAQLEEEKPKNSLDLLLEKAIDNATSHLEQSPKVRKRRMSWIFS
jgi:hypothetical protein